MGAAARRGRTGPRGASPVMRPAKRAVRRPGLHSESDSARRGHPYAASSGRRALASRLPAGRATKGADGHGNDIPWERKKVNALSNNINISQDKVNIPPPRILVTPRMSCPAIQHRADAVKARTQ